MGTTLEDDLLPVVEDNFVEGGTTGDGPGSTLPADRSWRILVVDDDEDVHATTIYALQGVEVLGRRLDLTHARSTVQALAILRRDPAFAAILLDVVMETPDAGLQLVRTIRTVLGLTTMRIILRTGQPGYAPELSVIRDYDIDDYRTKSELTRTRLLTSLHAALRAYSHIHALEASRRGLEQIIDASAELFRRKSLTAFCQGILTQLGGLLDIEANGIVLARTRPRTHAPGTTPTAAQPAGAEPAGAEPAGAEPAGAEPAGAEPLVLAAAGPHRHLSGARLGSVTDEPLRTVLHDTLERRTNLYQDHATVLHIRGRSGEDIAVYLATGRPLDPVDRQLLEVFSSNIALGFDNVSLLDHIRTLAFYDPLTGLPNRALFQEEIAARLHGLREEEDGAGELAVILLDLDHFQTVNDGLGQPMGDALLKAVGRQLRDLFGEPGAVARLASDMFGLLVRLHRPADEKELLDAIGLCFAAPFAVDGHPIAIRVSGGYALAEAGETDVPRLLRRAGMALKRAKRGGRGRILRFDTGMEEDLQHRLSLVSRIAEAQATGQFTLVYQPQLRLSDGAVTGVEALLRWRQPDGTWIRPDRFIPVAEDAGQIVTLGEWVLRQACLQQVQWRGRGVARLRMAVNVSVGQLRSDGFLHTAERVLLACGADPADIELEITESDAMEDDRVLATVQNLRTMGFSIAIDDFGTGYSSLSRLQQVPASVLKIDRSFVDGIGVRPERRSIAAMIVKVGHELGMDVLAEGVETVAQEAVLHELGCDAAQGYLYAKPLPAGDLEDWLKGRAPART